MKRDEFNKGLRAMLKIWEAGGQDSLESLIENTSTIKNKIQGMTDEQISEEIERSTDRTRTEHLWRDALRAECKERASRKIRRKDLK